MSLNPCECAELMKGRFYIDNFTVANRTGWRFFGNITSAAVTGELEEIEVVNGTRPNGGNCISLKRYSSLTMTLRNLDLCPDNRAILLAGDVYDDEVAGTAIPDAGTAIAAESHTAYPGRFVLLEHVRSADVTMTVTDTGTGTALAEGADYIVHPSAIQIVEGGAITAPTAVEVAYTARKASVVQAGTNLAREYIMRYVGENEIADGNPQSLGWFYRVNFAPGQLDLIQTGTDVAQPDFVAELLTATGSGVGTSLSPFYRIVDQPRHA